MRQDIGMESWWLSNRPGATNMEQSGCVGAIAERKPLFWDTVSGTDQLRVAAVYKAHLCQRELPHSTIFIAEEKEWQRRKVISGNSPKNKCTSLANSYVIIAGPNQHKYTQAVVAPTGLISTMVLIG